MEHTTRLSSMLAVQLNELQQVIKNGWQLEEGNRDIKKKVSNPNRLILWLPTMCKLFTKLYFANLV